VTLVDEVEAVTEPSRGCRTTHAAATLARLILIAVDRVVCAATRVLAHHKTNDLPEAINDSYDSLRCHDVGAELAFALERVTCRLANAPIDIAAMYAANYVPNNNPTLADWCSSRRRGDVAYVAGQTVAPQTATISAG